MMSFAMSESPADSSVRAVQSVVPFFQPILSVANGRIYGYEVLSRFQDPESGEYRSMGAFFHDEERSDAEKLAVDRQVRASAFREFRRSGIDSRLFVNIHPSWIFDFHDSEDVFPTIRLLEETGISGENIVIEITEQRFHDSDFEFLNRLIDRYRAQGMKIAIDDFSFPNFDRLIDLKPDFVKVDIQLVRKSAENEDYKRLIRYISTFCQELGIAVIFEGVESVHELENSIEAGGSFMQGFLFSGAQPEFQPVERYAREIEFGLNNVIYRSLHYSQNILKIEQSMNRYLAMVIEREQLFRRSNLDDAINKIVPFLPPQCFRAFVCDAFGKQRSSNFTKSDGGEFRIYPEHRGKNWGWRPYFFNNLVRMKEWGRGVISHKYVDVETKRQCLTFSFPIGDDLYIFVDFTAEP